MVGSARGQPPAVPQELLPVGRRHPPRRRRRALRRALRGAERPRRRSRGAPRPGHRVLGGRERPAPLRLPRHGQEHRAQAAGVQARPGGLSGRPHQHGPLRQHLDLHRRERLPHGPGRRLRGGAGGARAPGARPRAGELLGSLRRVDDAHPDHRARGERGVLRRVDQGQPQERPHLPAEAPAAHGRLPGRPRRGRARVLRGVRQGAQGAARRGDGGRAPRRLAGAHPRLVPQRAAGAGVGGDALRQPRRQAPPAGSARHLHRPAVPQGPRAQPGDALRRRRRTDLPGHQDPHGRRRRPRARRGQDQERRRAPRRLAQAPRGRRPARRSSSTCPAATCAISCACSAR